MINFWIGRWCFVLGRFDGVFDWAWRRNGYDCDWIEYSFGIFGEAMRMSKTMDEYVRPEKRKRLDWRLIDWWEGR